MSEVEFDQPFFACRLHCAFVSYIQIIVKPEEGLWNGGKFYFSVTIPDSYNIKVHSNQSCYCLIMW